MFKLGISGSIHNTLRKIVPSLFFFSMRYVAAYLLAVLGGNKNPSADDIKSILGSVSIDVDDDRLNIVMSELKGKNIEEVIAAG